MTTSLIFGTLERLQVRRLKRFGLRTLLQVCFQVREKAADLTAAFLAPTAQTSKLLRCQIACVVRDVGLRAQFPRRAFCAAQEFHEQSFRPALKSFRDIRLDGNRRIWSRKPKSRAKAPLRRSRTRGASTLEPSS